MADLPPQLGNDYQGLLTNSIRVAADISGQVSDLPAALLAAEQAVAAVREDVNFFMQEIDRTPGNRSIADKLLSTITPLQGAYNSANAAIAAGEAALKPSAEITSAASSAEQTTAPKADRPGPRQKVKPGLAPKGPV